MHEKDYTVPCSVTLEGKVYEAAKERARVESRTFSNMINVLVKTQLEIDKSKEK